MSKRDKMTTELLKMWIMLNFCRFVCFQQNLFNLAKFSAAR